MANWYADFKERSRITTIDRRKWDEHRDLVLDKFQAFDKEHARAVAFEQAYKFLDEPFMGELKELKEGIEEMPRSETLRGKVIGELRDYFNKHRGEIVSIFDLMKVTDFTEEQIRSSISYQRSQKNWPIEVIKRGQKWRLPVEEKVARPQENTKPETVRAVEEFIRETSDGSDGVDVHDDNKGFYMLSSSIDGETLIIQRDSDGTVWRATRL